MNGPRPQEEPCSTAARPRRVARFGACARGAPARHGGGGHGHVPAPGAPLAGHPERRRHGHGLHGRIYQLKGVGYGAVSTYQTVDPGTYTVQMRPSADPSAAPILTGTVRAEQGRAYTAAVLGPQAGASITLLTDDLTRPGPGNARVRVAAGRADGRVRHRHVERQPMTGPVAFATATPYVTAPAGRGTDRAGADDRRAVHVAGGSRGGRRLHRDRGAARRRDWVARSRPTRSAAAPRRRAGSRRASAAPPTAQPAPGRAARRCPSTARRPARRPASCVAARAPAPVRLVIPASASMRRSPPSRPTPAGALVPPTSTALVGWFAAGPPPGGTGPALLAGHVDSRAGPGVFFRLRDLRAGDRVDVVRADGSIAAFTVTGHVESAKIGVPDRPRLRPDTRPGAAAGHLRRRVRPRRTQLPRQHHRAALPTAAAGWTLR